jgi:hypothetical protein
MRKLTITEVEAGQVVARPVYSAGGLVLVQQGTTLTSELIARLLDHGVDCVFLEGSGPNAKPVEELLRDLSRRMAGHEQDPLMMELQAIIARRIQQSGTDGRDG